MTYQKLTSPVHKDLLLQNLVPKLKHNSIITYSIKPEYILTTSVILLTALNSNSVDKDNSKADVEII